MTVSRLKDRSEGMWGRIIVWNVAADPPQWISASEFRLLSSQSRKAFASDLATKVNHINWAQRLEAVCGQTVVLHEAGDPAILLTGETESLETNYLSSPLLVKNEMNMLFGDGGTFKSLIAQLLVFLIGHGESQLGFTFPEPVNCLYLDYETSREEVDKRLTALGRSLAYGTAGNFYYRHCELALADDADNIREEIVNKDIGLVVVDSYGMACGGDAITQEVVRSCCQALRSFNTTTLGIHHISTEVVKGGSPMPYGSRYWFNYHRWIWWVNAQTDDGVTTISLTHQKYNVGPKWPKPIGLRVKWQENIPYITRDDMRVEKTADLIARMTQKDQVRIVLRRGLTSVTEIAEKTGLKENQIRPILHRYPQVFVKVGAEWGLMSPEDGP